MNEKIEALREKFKNLDMQGMIITNPVSIRYLKMFILQMEDIWRLLIVLLQSRMKL